MNSRTVSLLMAILLLSAIPVSVSASETDDIPTNASATGMHDSLVAALTHADLVTTLSGDGPFTVFAPTDDAFANAGIDLSTFDTDEENATLIDILTYHVVSGDVRSTDLTDGMTADALNTDKLLFDVGPNGVMVNGASVTTADVVSSNGVIHVIDKVLTPPQDIYVDGGMMSEPYYEFYTDSYGQQKISSLNLSYNYKFQRLNSATSHPFYVSDNGYEGVSTDAITITGDGSASSGISGSESFTLFFHDDFAVDDALNYYCTVHSNMISQFNLLPRPIQPLDNIPTIASSTGVHSSLVAALAKADLVTTLEGTGPFTVFAPTDDAFTAAGFDLSAYESTEEISLLADILTYHVVSGSVLSTDLTDGMVAPALNGDNLSFTIDSTGVMVNDANVINPDVVASNGIIHVVDKVLMPPVELVDIPSVAQSTQIHTALVAALSKADLVTTLQGDGPFTVFAPTDDAFNAAGIDLTTYDTPEEIAALADILTYHVLSGAVKSTDLTDGMTAEAVNGDELSFSVNTDGVMVNDANVVSADVIASNGVVHVIDAVLMPPEDEEPADPDITQVAAGTGVHTALVAALSKANLVTTLQTDGPFTVFAPTDDAFATAGIDLDNFESDEEIAVLADILLFHVASGYVTSSEIVDGMTLTMANDDNVTFSLVNGSVMLGGATVTAADVVASNGIIHVIDSVLMPPEDIGDITEVASSTGIHTSLVEALVKAELVTTLQGAGPFTVFAPTDQAFIDAGIDLNAFETDDEIATLVDILTYHVVSGEVLSSSLSDGMTVTMLNGDEASVSISEGVVTINDATVVSADVATSNGVIHVIDKVLMPPVEEPTIVCDYTVGISAGGLEFSPAAITIDVGDTVCWKWSGESMAHNVVEVDGLKSENIVSNGVNSGSPAVTVDFHHTFEEATIFYYACEPHIQLDMFGKVTVGDGGVEPTVSDKKDKKSDNTPGFLGLTAILATLGALLYTRSRQE